MTIARNDYVVSRQLMVVVLRFNLLGVLRPINFDGYIAPS